jgi:hypothetical protein
MSGGILGNKKMSPEQRSQIDSANAMKPTNFTPPHGSQGVNNPNYADYVRQNPDLMANYNLHWRKGAEKPLSQNNEGISLAEFGAMHWNKSGRAEGRSMPGVSSSRPEEESGSGSSSGYDGSGWGTQLTGNIYHPQLVQEYSRPNMVPVEGLLDPRNPLSYIGDGALYQPGTVQSAAFVPDGIMGYQPPELSVGMPRMVGNPYGSLELPEGWEELLSGFEEEEEEGPESPSVEQTN